jgi:hypothetical protein
LAVTVFEEALTVYAALPERKLAEPWAWPGHEGEPLEVRDAVLRSLEMEHAALARIDASEPVFPDSGEDEEEDALTLATWLELLAAARGAAGALFTIPEGQLTRPTEWAGYAVDVTFRLHRFTGHLVQHTVQCEKVLRRLGHPETEARQLVRRISATRGGHELLNEPGVLRDLDEQHRRLADSISG